MSEQCKEKDLNKVRMVRIEVRQLLEMFRSYLGGSVIRIRGTSQIPEGCEVIGLPHADHYTRCLLLTVWHESFTPLLPFERLPVLDDLVEFEAVDPVEEAKKRILEEFVTPVMLDELKPIIKVETCECLGWAPTYPGCRDTYHHPACPKYRPDSSTPP